MKTLTYNPPAGIKADLDATWAWITKRRRDATAYHNWGWDHIMANGGHINYCIRWESTTVATPELRKLTSDTLNNQLNKWFDLLAGFEGWPYPKVPMRIVGWAGRDRSLFPGLNETKEGRYYNDKDRERIPQCAEDCGRFFHRNGQYANCPGGKDMHYDMSFWLTDKFGGGAVS
jgi:hypothetical protein